MFSIEVDGDVYVFRDCLTFGESLECMVDPSMGVQEMISANLVRVSLQLDSPKLSVEQLKQLPEHVVMKLIKRVQDNYVKLVGSGGDGGDFLSL